MHALIESMTQQNIKGLIKPVVTTDSMFFPYSLLLLWLLLLLVIGFPMRTRHQKAKCERLFPAEDLPVREHWGFHEEQAPACGGDQASPDWSQLKFMQFFSFPVLPKAEWNGKEACFIAQLLLHCLLSPQISSTWVIKQSTNSWKEQVFLAVKFELQVSTNSKPPRIMLSPHKILLFPLLLIQP